jgi:hypothetical protein
VKALSYLPELGSKQDVLEQQLTVVHPYSGILLSTKKKQAIKSQKDGGNLTVYC